jgi:hypothetical protein
VTTTAALDKPRTGLLACDFAAEDAFEDLPMRADERCFRQLREQS